MTQPLEGQGAFVTIDDAKLSRDGLVLRGCQIALEKCMNDLVQGAHAQTNPIIAQALMTIAARYQDHLNAVQVDLTRVATQCGAGVINTFRKD